MIKELNYVELNSTWDKQEMREPMNLHSSQPKKYTWISIFFDSEAQVKTKLKKKKLWTFGRKDRLTLQKVELRGNFFDKVDLKRLKGDFFLNQIFTAHGIFKTYQNRFFGKSEECNCEADKEDAQHLLLECWDLET
ncbi:hypothetical protein AVEN_185861-1 [Araneus ventricosus]|uniref:Uncharacterized protein n=1 Tax=Araneus ventricosus TaxID=182803 RepID=A0A4Y2MQM4_ARAVE|nr:hypothetical protein AVEN_185861-1 [Araneus ventricosus]